MKKLEKPQFDMETIIDNCLVHMQNPRKKRITLVKEKIKKKTEEAKLLLSGTHMSISEISDELSFSSRSFFFSSFQKETGMSPTKYRQLYTKS